MTHRSKLRGKQWKGFLSDPQSHDIHSDLQAAVKICQQTHYCSTLDNNLLDVDLLECISLHGRFPLDYYCLYFKYPWHNIPQLHYTFTVSQVRKIISIRLVPKVLKSIVEWGQEKWQWRAPLFESFSIRQRVETLHHLRSFCLLIAPNVKNKPVHQRETCCHGINRALTRGPVCSH